MKIQADVKLHNRFDLEVRDVITGKLKQKAQALNIVLNQMWTRLCAGSGYFGAIQFGSGSGTLTPARTSLFSHLGARWAADVTIIRALPTSSWRRRIVLNPEEFVGAVLSEVGIASSSGINDLVTHAMLEDSEGNPITITKTDVDVVTIFATVFVTFSTPSGVVLIGMPNSNSLVNWLIGGGSAPAGSFSLGEAVGAGHNSLAGIGSQPSLGGSPAVTWTADTPNRRRVSSVVRFGTTVGNGHVAEFAFSSLFRAELPLAGVFPGQPYTGVPVGTG
ncbi:MAG: hypothetical protein M1571_10500, partial [Firmicutes bacterium]|nr:hypothetical protein [Bacillota bacterium]